MAQTSSVIGLSSLREQEAPAPKTEQALRLEAYLRKYTDGGDGESDTKKKKKKKRKAAYGAGVKLHDEDVQWQVAKGASDVDDDPEDVAPVIANLAEAEHEVKLMKQAERYKDSWATVDVSTSRAQTAGAAADPPAKRARHDSDEDASPPRRGRARHDSDDEASPPRRRADVAGAGTAASGKATASGRAADEDASPPRRRARRHDSDEDVSPPRHSERTAAQAGGRPSAAEPPPHQKANAARRGVQRHDSDEDASPPRRGGRQHDSDSDASPPRRDVKANHEAAPSGGASGGRANGTTGTASAERQGPRSARMADGTSAGVVSAEQLGRELRAKRETERERILRMAASESGRGAQTTYRVGGKVVKKEEYEADRARADAKRKKPRYVEEDTEWKHGLAQQRAATAEAQAMQREAGKKFHREFDEDADADLKRELRADDPMAAYISSKAPEAVLQSTLPGHADLTSASGFAVPQEIPPHSWLKRRVQPPPNRYNIKPGRHWDGVVRGGKFEVFLFQHMNERRAYERDAYVYAEDY